MKHKSAFLLVLMLALSAPLSCGAGTVKVEKNTGGQWVLLRDGAPYHIKGAGGSRYLGALAAAGGNSLRIWGVDQIERGDEKDRNLLDHAHALGLAVTVGIWVHHPRLGFDFNDAAAVRKQRKRVRAAVRKYKNHPALLIWGLGNEVELATPGDDPVMWNELNELARIVKEEDPGHPVMTAIAGVQAHVVQAIMEHYPAIDILGVNTYDRAPRLHQELKHFGWDKPYIMSEFGPRGHWESKKTPWGAPVEQTSEAKAAAYAKAYRCIFTEGAGRCLGSYAFNWGHKQEVTPTWYGMHLESGERTPAVDAMTEAWTGRRPANRCPAIIAWTVPFSEKTIRPGAVEKISVDAGDPEGDPLTVTWWVMCESDRTKTGGDKETVPPTVAGVVTPGNAMRAAFNVPARSGNYRLFVKVADSHNNASIRNTPFRVAE